VSENQRKFHFWSTKYYFFSPAAGYQGSIVARVSYSDHLCLWLWRKKKSRKSMIFTLLGVTLGSRPIAQPRRAGTRNRIATVSALRGLGWSWKKWSRFFAPPSSFFARGPPLWVGVSVEYQLIDPPFEARPSGGGGTKFSPPKATNGMLGGGNPKIPPSSFFLGGGNENFDQNGCFAPQAPLKWTIYDVFVDNKLK